MTMAIAIIPSMTPALSQDAAADGRRVFMSTCATCHLVTNNGRSTIGPNLHGVVGRRTAALPNFMYSSAMRRANSVWTADRITAFVQAPQHVVPGTRMSFAGLRNPQQASHVVAFLNSLP
jgi:cytochrome c